MTAWWLKFRLQRLWKKYRDVCDEWPCGSFLTNYLSPRAYTLATEINKVLDRLALLDPSAPTFRIKLPHEQEVPRGS